MPGTARPARTARHEPRQRHRLADAQRRHARTDRLDDAGALVAHRDRTSVAASRRRARAGPSGRRPTRSSGRGPRRRAARPAPASRSRRAALGRGRPRPGPWSSFGHAATLRDDRPVRTARRPATTSRRRRSPRARRPRPARSRRRPSRSPRAPRRSRSTRDTNRRSATGGYSAPVSRRSARHGLGEGPRGQQEHAVGDRLAPRRRSRRARGPGR